MENANSLGRLLARQLVETGETVLLDLLVERRWHIVSQRQKTLCRIHDQLVALTPGGSSQHLTVTKVAAELRRIRPTDEIGMERKAIAKELLAELRVLDRKRKDNERRIAETLESYGTTLTSIPGIAHVGAATILSVVGDVSRFPFFARSACAAASSPVVVI